MNHGRSIVSWVGRCIRNGAAPNPCGDGRHEAKDPAAEQAKEEEHWLLIGFIPKRSSVDPDQPVEIGCRLAGNLGGKSQDRAWTTAAVHGGAAAADSAVCEQDARARLSGHGRPD